MTPKPVPPRQHSRRHADAVMFNYIHELSGSLAGSPEAPSPDPEIADASR